MFVEKNVFGEEPINLIEQGFHFGAFRVPMHHYPNANWSVWHSFFELFSLRADIQNWNSDGTFEHVSDVEISLCDKRDLISLYLHSPNQ